MRECSASNARTMTDTPTDTPSNQPQTGRKDLGNFIGMFHSALAANFHAGGSNYSQTTYDPLKAFLPDHLLTWVSHVAKFWFHKKHNFRDYTTPRKGNGIHEIADRTRISLIGDWGTGTDEAQMVANQVKAFGPD